MLTVTRPWLDLGVDSDQWLDLGVDSDQWLDLCVDSDQAMVRSGC